MIVLTPKLQTHITSNESLKASAFSLGGDEALSQSQNSLWLGEDVLISEVTDYEHFTFMEANPKFNLLIPVRQDQADHDLQAAAEFLKTFEPGKSAVRSSSKPNIHQRELEMTMSHERWAAIEDLGEYIKVQAVFGDLVEIGKTVASELLTNAFYNAPRAPTGEPLQPHRSRTARMTPPAKIKFNFGDDGSHIWLSVTDPFGTFKRDKLFKLLAGNARDAKMRVNEGVGGAGIGIYLMYKWASQILFEFVPGERTTVLVKLIKTRRQKAFANQRAVLEVLQLAHRVTSKNSTEDSSQRTAS